MVMKNADTDMKQDCRSLFEDNIQNLPRLREIWINYNLELLPLSDGGSFGKKNA
jgi:hypothetical protein